MKAPSAEESAPRATEGKSMNLFSMAPRGRLRIIIVAAVLALAAVLTGISLRAASAQASPARAGSAAPQAWTGGPKPVIVLVHGAWADASSWDGVISRLTSAGFTVYAPPDPLRGLSSDAAYLRDFLTDNPALAGKPVVLVGHSYGGAVITNAAVGDPEVKALVYVDAFIPDQGQTVEGLLTAVPGSCIAGNPATTFYAVPYPGAPAGSEDLYLQPGEFPGCFASGLPGWEAARLAATQRPLAAAAVAEPSGPPAWATIPSWAVIGTGDKVIPPAEQLAMAQHADAQVTEISGGHLSLISNPRAVAAVIMRAAAAVS
jgi:pimeloyl-ACP methyl ester carboxylesterase